jgi:hypothetical protein
VETHPKADDQQERIDLDELLATSKHLIEKMKTLIENAQKVLQESQRKIS